MAKISDMKMKYRIFMKTYKYRSLEWSPGTFLDKPLTQSRIAAVSTAAFYAPPQEPFDAGFPGGDYSFRVISNHQDTTMLKAVFSSDSFDHSGIEKDPNLALPLDRLKELEKEGLIGSSAPRHLSFMGTILAPEQLISETAEDAADLFREDRVDGVILTPV